jgi:hypothetical protein
MIVGEGFLGLVVLAVWMFCIIDVITTDDSAVRNLPKAVWLLIVIVLFDLGALAWLIAGRNWNRAAAAAARAGRQSAARSVGATVPTNPDDDEEFLRSLQRRAEEQRRSHQDNRPDDPNVEPERPDDTPAAG